jgi:hypothetical protein
VLAANAFLAAAELGLRVAPPELLETVLDRHGLTVVAGGTKVNGFIDFHRGLRR